VPACHQSPASSSFTWAIRSSSYAVLDEVAVALRREVGHRVTQPLKDLKAFLVAQGLDEVHVKHKGIMING
jgi:hypothetical protein